MKNLILWIAAFAALLIGAPVLHRALTPKATTTPAPPIVLAAVVETPSAAPLAQPPVPQPSPPAFLIAVELESLMATFTPSWADHEEASHLAARRRQIAGEIAGACVAEFPNDVAQARKYAITLTYLGQRETRFAEHVELLGNQDHGQAHGFWQIHAWKGMSPNEASTAASMLHASPGDWALPQPSPWLGCPPAAEYLRLHP